MVVTDLKSVMRSLKSAIKSGKGVNGLTSSTERVFVFDVFISHSFEKDCLLNLATGQN